MEIEQNKVINMFQDTIYRQDKKPVLMDTLTCITHRFSKMEKHGCTGCDGELQCTKMTVLLMLDVFSRTGQIALFGITSGFAVMEYMVDVARAKNLDALNAVLSVALRRQIMSGQ